MNICYYCGLEANTAEHVPPQGIFPRQKDSPDGKDFRKQLIRVPSCENHNTDKSGEDEYLRYVLTTSLPSNAVAKHQFLIKIMRAIQRRPKLVERLLTETQEVVVHDTVADTWEKTIAYAPRSHALLICLLA